MHEVEHQHVPSLESAQTRHAPYAHAVAPRRPRYVEEPRVGG